MKRRYYCPECNANLNPNVKIILMVQCRGHQGLILLSPRPGDYSIIVADEIELQEGDLVAFHCPVCGAVLDAEEKEGMAHLMFRFSNGNQGTVYFSRRFGEHATYFVAVDEVRVYGRNASPPVAMNFFGSGQDQD
jgi:predicted RNA-binding Zn-ribbon protein involved in translation (DUF1610 family)